MSAVEKTEAMSVHQNYHWDTFSASSREKCRSLFIKLLNKLYYYGLCEEIVCQPLFPRTRMN